MLRVPDESAATALVCQQINRERVRPNLHFTLRTHALNYGSHHFMTRRVSQRVYDPAMAMPAFAAEHEFAFFGIEIRAPLDQLSNMLWRLAHHHFNNVAIAQIRTCNERIVDVALEVLLGPNDARDAALH